MTFQTGSNNLVSQNKKVSSQTSMVDSSLPSFSPMNYGVRYRGNIEWETSRWLQPIIFAEQGRLRTN